MNSCGFPGCDRKHEAKGLCHAHYLQSKSGTSPLKPIRCRRKSGIPIIGYKTNSNGCHVFSGRKNDDGYGMVSVSGKQVRAHRYVWERDVGPIPPGMVIDHKCRNRACCNVDHLRVVTLKVNNTENVVGSPWQINAAKSHCDRGHEFTEENTYIVPSTKRRACRKCSQVTQAAAYAARKKVQN